MPRLEITRGAGLIYNGQAPLKPIVYDETDKTTTVGYYEGPVNQQLYGTYSASGMVVTWSGSGSAQAPASIVISRGYTVFSFTAFRSYQDLTTFQVVGQEPTRTIEVTYISGWDGSNPIYSTDTVTVKDFVVRFSRYQTETVWNIAYGGVVKHTNPDRTESYTAYDWNDQTYGQPYKKVSFVGDTAVKYNGNWYSTIRPAVMNVNGSGVPIYDGSNSYYFLCPFDSPGHFSYRVTTTNLTATNQTS